MVRPMGAPNPMTEDEALAVARDKADCDDVEVWAALDVLAASVRQLRRERDHWKLIWIASVVDQLDEPTATRLLAQVPKLALGESEVS